MSDIKYPRLQYRMQLMFHVQLVLWYRPLYVPGTAFRFLRESARKWKLRHLPVMEDRPSKIALSQETRTNVPLIRCFEM